jgi:probable phosphomutase (TIGR03848 family)
VALLLLIRHALTDSTGKRLLGTTPGVHLSAEGRDQARRLAERLAPLPIRHVYASPLDRCLETALAIAELRGLPVRPLPELQEVGYGSWTGRSIRQVMRTALWRRVQTLPSSVRFPGGESLAEAQRRAVGTLDALAARHPRSIVAVVTHADVIRLAVAHYAGVHLDLFQRIVVDPASVSAIALGDRVPRIVRLNDTGSMDDVAVRARHPTRAGAPDRTRTGPRASRPPEGKRP